MPLATTDHGSFGTPASCNLDRRPTRWSSPRMLSSLDQLLALAVDRKPHRSVTSTVKVERSTWNPLPMSRQKRMISRKSHQCPYNTSVRSLP